MNMSRFVALAVVVLGLGTVPVVAAPIDYFLNIPLFSADEPQVDTGLTLRGTLTYDGAEEMQGHGTFALGAQAARYFAGLTFLMDLSGGPSPGTGILFDGAGDDGSHLYMNLAINAAQDGSGSVTYCAAGGCSFFNAVGAVLDPAETAPILVPSEPVTVPSLGVSAVPLPPAFSLFGAALLALAGAETIRRRARPMGVRV